VKLKPHKIKEVSKTKKFGFSYYDYLSKSPQDYYNNLTADYDGVHKEMEYRKSRGAIITNLINRLDWLRGEINDMKVELSDDFIYTPTKKVEVKSITDILHYERLHGKKIYEKEFCNTGHV